MTNGLTILGVPVDNVTMEETLAKIEEFIHERGCHQIATANVDFLVNAVDNHDYRDVLCRCDLVVADGMPLILASKLLGVPLRERVTGSDLVPLLARLSAEKKYGIFMLGSRPEVSEIAARKLTEMGANIVGRLTPPASPLDEFDYDGILAEIEKANPDILLVAMGSPKQEMWISRCRNRLKVPVCIGIGCSFDLIAGSLTRAPLWMQKSSLEWLYRLSVEPRRLAKRYLKDAAWMARYFTVQLALSVAKRQTGRALQVISESIGSVRVLRATGMMAGPRLVQLEQQAFPVTDQAGALVIDLADVTYLGADGIRALAGVLRSASSRGRQLWLAGVTPALFRTLKASGCEGLFRAAPSVLAAVRQASDGRLQLSLELGDGWAVCRIGGEMPQGAHKTVEAICRQVLETNQVFELDSSGVPEFDASSLEDPGNGNCRLVLGDGTERPIAAMAVGAAAAAK